MLRLPLPDASERGAKIGEMMVVALVVEEVRLYLRWNANIGGGVLSERDPRCYKCIGAEAELTL